MRRKNLIRGLKKKTRLPFHGKAEGGSARRRADRLATYRKPGPPGDVEPINPNEPNAPPDGAVRQKFQAGGAIPPGFRARSSEPRERPALPNVELERPSVKELDLDLRPSVKEVGPPKRKAGGHITTAQRKALPSGDFALPGKGKGAGGKGPGAYPIDTPGRARSALSRGKQHASSGELATIKRKVEAKYPGMDVK
jgi:hypothetical protein